MVYIFPLTAHHWQKCKITVKECIFDKHDVISVLVIIKLYSPQVILMILLGWESGFMAAALDVLDI